MDIFGTAITAGNLILKFLEACAAYSEDAMSLHARFDWDLRVLTAVRCYFDERRDANQRLSPENAALLERTAHYLDRLLGRVQRSVSWIERKGLWHNVINRGMWIARQAELQEMQKEVRDWTIRFDVHVLGFPQELRNIIPVTDDAKPPALVRSNEVLRAFIHGPADQRTKEAKRMRLGKSEELAAEITGLGDVSFMPLQYDGQQIILASRMVPQTEIPGSREFDSLDAEMGTLAAALNRLEPTGTIRLLKVVFYFFHPSRGQFIFAHISPYPILSMKTLDDAIRGDSYPEVEATLNQRLKLALKLAEAVLFLHSAGFVHKNITSLSIAVLRRLDSSPSNENSGYSSIDDAYLMGFDLIRDIEGRTISEGLVEGADGDPRPIWEFDIFQHPDRLQGKPRPRYTKTHDVYSLGVVLLEVGLWEQLSKAVSELGEESPSTWADKLKNAVAKIGPRVGERYQRLVSWCLDVDGNVIVKETDFVEKVLDPLEAMVNALS